METLLIIIFALAGIIGLWALYCLIGGAVDSRGPLNLTGNWFKSLSGGK